MTKVDCEQETIEESENQVIKKGIKLLMIIGRKIAIEERKKLEIEKGIKEGIEIGIKEGKILLIKEQLNDNEITVNAAISYLLSANCKLEEISEITNTPIDIINQFKNKIN